MTVQLEDGYTRIAHELIEAMARVNIPASCMQCFLVILRQTYGYHRKEALISLKDFSEATGMHRQNAYRSIKRLVAMNMIAVINPDYSEGATYRPNKKYAEWQTGSGSRPSPVINPDYSERVSSTRITPCNQPGLHPVINPDYTHPIIKYNLKDNFKDNISRQLFSEGEKKEPETPKKSERKKRAISPQYIEFVKSYQEYIQKEFGRQAPKVTTTLINSGAEVIDRIVRLDGYAFKDIQDALRWAAKDDFWSSQVRSLAQLRKKGNNGLSKIQNIFESRERSGASTSSEIQRRIAKMKAGGE